MIKLYNSPVYFIDNEVIIEDIKTPEYKGVPLDRDEAIKGTIAYSLFKAHNTSKEMKKLKLKFDAMASHDITFVGIIQTAKASGMTSFPLPYVLSNCH